jgi:uridylate kinase
MDTMGALGQGIVTGPAVGLPSFVTADSPPSPPGGVHLDGARSAPAAKGSAAPGHTEQGTTGKGPVRARRVVLKLSGEVFGGGKIGLDPDVVQGLAHQIATVVRLGLQVAVVVGGGNFFRGAELQERGMDRPRADYMGMLSTVLNCLALQDFLEKQGIETRVQTAISMAQVAEPYIPRRAIRHLEKGRVVIFGAGAGMPYFTTDTVAAQRALEIHADIVLMSKNGVDGVYTADPRTDPGARKLDTVTFDEALRRGLKVVDAAAFSLCHENRLPMLVFGAEGADTIVRAVGGERIGTLITAAPSG